MPKPWKPLQEIHNSLVVGQRGQMVKQINEYGTSDFLPEYIFFLTVKLELSDKEILKYFSDCVISYHRISSGDTIIEVK